MRRRVALVVGAVAIALGACASPAPSASPSAAGASAAATTAAASPSAADPTAAYLAKLDLPAILDAAASYGTPVAPGGDPNAYVARLQWQYRGVDRVAVFREVFARLTAGAATETDRERAVLGFVQHLSVHDRASPFMSLPIFDPLSCSRSTRWTARRTRA